MFFMPSKTEEELIAAAKVYPSMYETLAAAISSSSMTTLYDHVEKGRGNLPVITL